MYLTNFKIISEECWYPQAAYYTEESIKDLNISQEDLEKSWVIIDYVAPEQRDGYGSEMFYNNKTKEIFYGYYPLENNLSEQQILDKSLNYSEE